MTWLQRCSIIPLANVAYARSMCGANAGPSGEGMWKAELSATGLAPATHFLSIGRMRNDFAGLLPLDSLNEDGLTFTRLSAGQPNTVFSMSQSVGFVTTVLDITALFTAATITADEVERLGAILAAKGLKRIGVPA